MRKTVHISATKEEFFGLLESGLKTELVKYAHMAPDVVEVFEGLTYRKKLSAKGRSSNVTVKVSKFQRPSEYETTIFSDDGRTYRMNFTIGNNEVVYSEDILNDEGEVAPGIMASLFGFVNASAATKKIMAIDHYIAEQRGSQES